MLAPNAEKKRCDRAVSIARIVMTHGGCPPYHPVTRRRCDRGQVEREYVVELTQTRWGYLDRGTQMKVDKGGLPRPKADFKFRRGCTLLIDARSFEVRRVICTRCDILDDEMLEQKRASLMMRGSTPDNAFSGPEATLKADAETFAHLHSNYG